MIPTEAFPGGIKIAAGQIVVTNLESDGANVVDKNRKARSIHNQLASVSIIPIPENSQLNQYTWQVTQQNLLTRSEQLQADKNAKPVPVPVHLGEPSVFKHVVYIIKENKTYDQVYGDMKEGQRRQFLMCIWQPDNTQYACVGKTIWLDGPVLRVRKILCRRTSMDRCRYGV